MMAEPELVFARIVAYVLVIWGIYRLVKWFIKKGKEDIEHAKKLKKEFKQQ